LAKVVEPPILMSRTLTLVLATAIAVLLVLVLTLYKMAPLTKPEVFFLSNDSRNVNYVLKQPNPKKTYFQDEYINGFIRAYIIARNTLYDRKTTELMWGQVVHPWSSKAVLKDFMETDVYSNPSAFRDIRCEVILDDNSVFPMPDTQHQHGKYLVTFKRECFNQKSGGQTAPKSYSIKIAIQSYLDAKSDIVFKSLEKFRENPLGVQVTEYKVEGTDPLSDIDSEFYKEGK